MKKTKTETVTMKGLNEHNWLITDYVNQTQQKYTLYDRHAVAEKSFPACIA